MADIERVAVEAGEKELIAHSVYLFRCGESGVFAVTVDRTGQILPRVYPRMRWSFQRQVALRSDDNAAKQGTFKAALDSIKRRGFCLTYAGARSVGLLLGPKPRARPTAGAPADQSRRL